MAMALRIRDGKPNARTIGLVCDLGQTGGVRFGDLTLPVEFGRDIGRMVGTTSSAGFLGVVSRGYGCRRHMGRRLPILCLSDHVPVAFTIGWVATIARPFSDYNGGFANPRAARQSSGV